MKRMARTKWLLTLVLSGAALTQLGPCGAAYVNGGLAAFDFCAILGPDCTLGPIAPCGNPLTSQDDLLLDCPKPIQEIVNGGGGGGTGGGGGGGGGGTGGGGTGGS